MKKIFSVLMILFVSLSFVACGSDDDDDNGNGNNGANDQELQAKLVGKWQPTFYEASNDHSKDYWLFNADKTFLDYQYPINSKDKGTWTVEKGQIKMKYDALTIIPTYDIIELTDTKLTIGYDYFTEGYKKLTYKKVQ